MKSQQIGIHSGNGDGLAEQEAIGVQASFEEVLQHRSLADWTEEELMELPRLLQLDLRVPKRLRRRSKAWNEGNRMDLRRTVHRSLRREGELLERVWRRRIRRTRPILVLIDVSGSMSGHSRALLHFAYVLTSSDLRVETFCFGTRLTRVTQPLAGRNPNRAVASATDAIGDWSGGTRIGEALNALFKDWGYRAGVRGSVVLLFSDGLERGDPTLLANQMKRLTRVAHTVVWLNPLKGDNAYLPLARGMQAALPYVDRFVAANSLHDLNQLGRTISKLV